jgi:hypothetical protein
MKLNEHEIKDPPGLIMVEIDNTQGEYAAALEVQFPSGCYVRFFSR